MARNGRTVSLRADGQWANMKDSGARASSFHKTQKQATDATRAALKESGGGN
jgi:hypothetical protein